LPLGGQLTAKRNAIPRNLPLTQPASESSFHSCCDEAYITFFKNVMVALEVLPDVQGFLQLITTRVLFSPQLLFRLVLSFSICK
jgi:hypothetical protein